jgi:hypothetical protein
MKKFIFMILATILSSVAISSCTEEDVQPTNESDCPAGCGGNGGGNTSDFPRK